MTEKIIVHPATFGLLVGCSMNLIKGPDGTSCNFQLILANPLCVTQIDAWFPWALHFPIYLDRKYVTDLTRPNQWINKTLISSIKI